MANASTPPAAAPATIDPAEAAHFGALAADWWNPRGSSAMLHRLNPVRLRYLREAIDRRWGAEAADRRPLAGRRALDVGCGAGLLCEPLARLGAAVTGVDASPEAIAAARTHAEGQGLTIDYRSGELDQLCDARFDLVTAMEVIEHVVDPAIFLARLAERLAPGGLLVLSTPNRTALSRLALIVVGEGAGLIPRGTHDWRRFIAPNEMSRLLADAGLDVIDRRGIAFSPGRGFAVSSDLALDYLVTAARRGDDMADDLV